MKALRNTLAALLVLGAIAVLAAPAPAGADIIQAPVYLPEAETGDIVQRPVYLPEGGANGAETLRLALLWLNVL
jgi:hypothetical protein